MKITARNATFVLLLITAGSAQAQYKYDIGLRVSSLGQEQFQIQQRFHLNSPYSLVASYTYGSSAEGNWHNRSNYYDSTIILYNDYSSSRYHTLKFGAQRKINGWAKDLFYFGADFGVSHQQQTNTYLETTYTYNDSFPPNPIYYYGQGDGEITAETSTYDFYRLLHFNLGLNFGMDVPLSKRFILNLEVAVSGGVATYLDYKASFFNFQQSVSGGLRYQFGLREKSVVTSSN